MRIIFLRQIIAIHWQNYIYNASHTCFLLFLYLNCLFNFVLYSGIDLDSKKSEYCYYELKVYDTYSYVYALSTLALQRRQNNFNNNTNITTW